MLTKALHRVRDYALPLIRVLGFRPQTGNPRRLMIFQPDHVGDIILAEPAVRYIRETCPDCELLAIVGPWSTEITRLAWPVDDIICVDYPGFDRLSATSPLDPYQQLFKISHQLQKYQAGRAVVMREDGWWAAALAWLSVSGSVVTSSYPTVSHFSTHTVDLTSIRHATAKSFELMVCAAGMDVDYNYWDMSPQLLANPTNPASASQTLKTFGINDSQPYIVVHPGTGAAVKLWSRRSWRSVIAAFPNVNIIVTGTSAESELCMSICTGFTHTTNLAGRTSLSDLIEILRGAAVAVGTDNGPLHIATATQTPSVRIFGPSDPQKYGPWPTNDGLHQVVSAGWTCNRCGDLSLTRAPMCGCMLAVNPETVISAVHRGLSRAISE